MIKYMNAYEPGYISELCLEKVSESGADLVNFTGIGLGWMRWRQYVSLHVQRVESVE